MIFAGGLHTGDIDYPSHHRLAVESRRRAAQKFYTLHIGEVVHRHRCDERPLVGHTVSGYKLT